MKGLAHILHSKSSSTAATRSHQREQDPIAASSDADDDDLLIKRDRVMAYIEYSVSPHILLQIERLTDPQLALETLESLYKPSSRELWLEAMIRLSTILYHPHITLVEHFGQLEECFQTIEANGGGIDDNLKIMHLWRSLGQYFREKYKQYARTAKSNNQTYFDVKEGLLEDEAGRRGILPSTNPTALHAGRTRFLPSGVEIMGGKNSSCSLDIGSCLADSIQMLSLRQKRSSS
ncbi:hypothetical protein BKA69DRAFT_624942 [Paraphysoderma sedebokerense]|nr:hypothetical protein BKA69DRAFT_624942 [Paraphysoderma sedebokerense]